MSINDRLLDLQDPAENQAIKLRTESSSFALEKSINFTSSAYCCS